MCIMEVREGQLSSTIAQAMAHNASTVQRDLEMFRVLLAARGATESLEALERANEAMLLAYGEFLECYVVEIEGDVQRGHGIACGTGDGDHGHGERPHTHSEVDEAFIEAAVEHMRAASARAKPYETR